MPERARRIPRAVPVAAELPYRSDGAELFAAMADEPWAVFLDSGPPDGRLGRFDILAAEPWATVTTRAGVTEVRQEGGCRRYPDNPFEVLRRVVRPGEAGAAPGRLPFAGGAIGYFGYDLGRRLESLPARAEDSEDLPELAVGLYDWAVVLDHRERRAWLVGGFRDPRTRRRWPELVARFRDPAVRPPHAPLRVRGEVRPNLDAVGYAAAFARVQRYIRDGDCYQVNLARRFVVPAQGDLWSAYTALRRFSPAPFAAYLNTPDATLLSDSPERFLHVTDGRVETRPIKGTRPRAPDPDADRRLAEALRESPKDRAENVMIVDLLRNDLGKNCRPGSVRVPELFRVESFPTVHHLVSTVTGELAPGRDALHLLEGCFPGGSITGAPKVRAMEIIEELEPNRRGVYCGAIGYLGYDGNMDTNIAIRTLVYNHGLLRFWAGGGIVHDSREEEEFQETLDKAAAMLRLLGDGDGGLRDDEG